MLWHLITINLVLYHTCHQFPELFLTGSEIDLRVIHFVADRTWNISWRNCQRCTGLIEMLHEVRTTEPGDSISHHEDSGKRNGSDVALLSQVHTWTWTKQHVRGHDRDVTFLWNCHLNSVLLICKPPVCKHLLTHPQSDIEVNCKSLYSMVKLVVMFSKAGIVNKNVSVRDIQQKPRHCVKKSLMRAALR